MHITIAAHCRRTTGCPNKNSGAALGDPRSIQFTYLFLALCLRSLGTGQTPWIHSPYLQSMHKLNTITSS